MSIKYNNINSEGIRLTSQTGDLINKLPVDNSPPTHNEIELIESLFNQKTESSKNLVELVKSYVIIGILFFILSLPFVDILIKKILSYWFESLNENYIIITIIKTLLFMFFYFFINNLKLIKK